MLVLEVLGARSGGASCLVERCLLLGGEVVGAGLGGARLGAVFTLLSRPALLTHVTLGLMSWQDRGGPSRSLTPGPGPVLCLTKEHAIILGVPPTRQGE